MEVKEKITALKDIITFYRKEQTPCIIGESGSGKNNTWKAHTG